MLKQQFMKFMLKEHFMKFMLKEHFMNYIDPTHKISVGIKKFGIYANKYLVQRRTSALKRQLIRMKTK